MKLQREMLKQRHKTQLRERRAQRRNEFNNSQDAVRATTLEEMQRVTSRAGFLREQLKATELTPLRRWHLQLKLLVVEDNMAIDVETVLAKDQRCFDVVYREGARATDAQESLLDDGAPTNVKEVLSFSTKFNGCVCRVTCVNDGKNVTFTSSVYVENLQSALHDLLQTTQPVHAAVTFLAS